MGTRTMSGTARLKRAIRAYAPLFIADWNVPPRLRPEVAATVADDQLPDLYDRVLLSGDVGLVVEASQLWQRIRDEFPDRRSRPGDVRPTPRHAAVHRRCANR